MELHKQSFTEHVSKDGQYTSLHITDPKLDHRSIFVKCAKNQSTEVFL